MNQFKTFFITILFIQISLLSESRAELNRLLKADEIKILESNIAAEPTNVRSRLFLADHYYKDKKWLKVIQLLIPIAEKIDSKTLYKLGNSHYMASNYLEASKIIDTLLGRGKDSLQVYLLSAKISAQFSNGKGNAEVVEKNKNKIFDTLKIAQSLHPQALELYDLWLAVLDSATDHYRNIVPQVMPDSEKQKYTLSYATDTLGVLRDMYDKKVVYLPRHYSLLCKHSFLAHFNAKTKEHCQDAIVKDPNNPNNHIYLGQTHFSSGDKKEGKRILASVGDQFSESEEALWATGNAHFNGNDMASAYKYFKKASQTTHPRPRDFLGLAKASFELKKYSEALKSFVEHCHRSGVLDHEFRKASGLLIDKPKLQEKYRQKMLDCRPR